MKRRRGEKEKDEDGEFSLLNCTNLVWGGRGMKGAVVPDAV
jgi:hypothetical protein